MCPGADSLLMNDTRRSAGFPFASCSAMLGSRDALLLLALRARGGVNVLPLYGDTVGLRAGLISMSVSGEYNDIGTCPPTCDRWPF